MISTCSGLGRGPRKVAAGSEGTTRARRKVIIDRPMRTKTRKKSLLTMYVRYLIISTPYSGSAS
jgi:hypothetical protein